MILEIAAGVILAAIALKAWASFRAYLVIYSECANQRDAIRACTQTRYPEGRQTLEQWQADNAR